MSATSRQSVRRAAAARARGLWWLTHEEWPDGAFGNPTIAPRWQARGLAPPDAVMAATAEYRDESDVLGSFLAERTTTEPEYAGATARVAAGALFKAYQAWCLEGGLRPDSQTAFGRELTKRGFAAQAGGGGANFRMGLRLIAADEATGEGVDGF